MRPYTVKNYLWLAIVVMVIMIACLSGCSSAPKVQARKPQYCYTHQTIDVKNGETVDSRTRLECTDDQVERLTAKRMGLANNCGEFTYWMKIGNSDVQRKGISCQRLDGSWEVVNLAGR